MKYLLKDVNLSSNSISNDGMEITTNFVNMFNGNPSASLIADAVILFNYCNNFDNSEDALPAYIGEVTCKEVIREKTPSELLGLGYNFTGPNGQTFIPGTEKLFFIHLEGGAVSIDLVCSGYKIKQEEP